MLHLLRATFLGHDKHGSEAQRSRPDTLKLGPVQNISKGPQEAEGEGEIFFEIRYFDLESQSELRERRLKIPKQSLMLECAKKNILIARYLKRLCLPSVP